MITLCCVKPVILLHVDLIGVACVAEGCVTEIST